jgi:hypothetical protein
MKYTITPLNVLMLVFLIKVVYGYATMTHDDGLGATSLVMAIAAALVVLLVDLAIQNFVGTYNWIFIIEIILGSLLLFWAIKGGKF